MRLAVLDMGSNTAHLLLVDAYPGARPLPAYEHKIELLLSELLDDKGRVTSDGVDRLVAFCAEALEIATYDALEEAFRTFKVRRDPQCPACGENAGEIVIAEYDEHCLPHATLADGSTTDH